MNAHFIINPAAGGGRGRQRWESARRQLQSEGLVISACETSRPGEAIELARAACARFETIVAVGGDGTAHEVANGILAAGNPDVALAVIPTGTGNDIAALAGVRSVKEAVDALRQGAWRPIDVIETSCDGWGTPLKRHALLFAAAGFAAEVLKRTTPRIKRWFGPRLCYAVGLFSALAGYRAPLFRVSAGGRVWHAPLLLTSAGNAEFASGGRMRLFPGARVDDARLNLSCVAAMSFWRVARCFPRLANGTYVDLPESDYLEGDEMELGAEPPTEVQADGEIIGKTPASFRICPGALRLVVHAPRA